jgi:tetratricopeptide (TPR) repeat protein
MQDLSRWGTSPQALLRRVIRAETVRLAVLVAVAAVTFAATRQLAQARHARDQQDAAAWYTRGQQLAQQGDLEGAASAFRRAMSKRPETAYVLELADTLVRAGALDAASRVLLRRRDATPEDPEINRALARVAAAQGEVTAATRYYHNALYGPWTSHDGPRALRLELIRFLLGHDDNRRAIAELIAASTDVPDEPEAHLQLGTLLAEAGDPARALDQFSRALRLAPRHRAALEGAVGAAFALGDYERVRRYALPADAAAETRQLRAVADLVVTQDPLATRISAATRHRRLRTLVDRARARVRTCAAAGDPAAASIAGQVTALDAMRLDRPAVGRDAEVIEAALLVLADLHRRLDGICGERTPLDRALALIADRHGVAQP